MVGAILAGLPDVAAGTGVGPAFFSHIGVGRTYSPQVYDIPEALHRSYGRPNLGSDAPSGVVYVKLCNFRFMAEGVIG